MDELTRIAAEARAIFRDGARGALCTIVRASGSVLRGPGARMLIRDDGSLRGHLSGGCLEADLAERAKKVFASNDPYLVVYRPEAQHAVFGVQSGCDGALEILIEPLTAALNEEVQRVVARRAFETIVAISAFGAERAERRTWFFLEPWPADARPPADEDSEGVFRQRIAPVVSLLVFGAGPVAPPLTRIAKALGWRVVVADHRAAHATRELLPEADEVVVAPAGSLVSSIPFGARPVAVVMAHQWDFDLSMLRDLLPRGLRYLGLLGSRSRRDKLLAELGLPGAETLHAPAGLALGGETPEEIALSMVAEIQSVLHGADALPLRSREGSIHEGGRKPRTAAVVLAAGGSKRYGSPKQLALVEGEALLRRVVRTVQASGVDRVFVVLGADRERVMNALVGLDVETIVNEEWASGMASSIRAGVAAASDFDAVLLMLGDQPLVSTAQLDQILATRRRTGNAVVASRYPEGAGAPALFASSAFADLMRLVEDHGAREVIRSRGPEVALVDSLTADVDRPEDLVGLVCR